MDPQGLEIAHHGVWLRRLARGLARGDDAAAADLVQDTWLAGLSSPPAGAPGRAWWAAVLRNLVRQRHRREARRVRREREVSAGVDRSSGADEALIRHETQRRLSQLVSELDEPYRTAVLLRYSEDLTPAEIAARLGVPAGTVRWRLKMALDRLRAAVGEGGRFRLGVSIGPVFGVEDDVPRLVLTVLFRKKALLGLLGLLVVLGTAGILRSRLPGHSGAPAPVSDGPPLQAAGGFEDHRAVADRSLPRAPAGERRNPPPRLVVAPEAAAQSPERIEASLRDRWAQLGRDWPACLAGTDASARCQPFQTSVRELAVAAHKRAQKHRTQGLKELTLELYEAYFRTAPAGDPALYEMTFYSGELYWSLERWSEAAAQYRRVVELDPRGKYSEQALDAKARAARNAASARP